MREFNFIRLLLVNLFFFSAIIFFYILLSKGNYYIFTKDYLRFSNFFISFILINIGSLLFINNTFVEKVFSIYFALLLVPSCVIYAFMGNTLFLSVTIFAYFFTFYISKLRFLNYENRTIKINIYEKKKLILFLCSIIILFLFLYTISIFQYNNLTFNIREFSDNRALLNLSTLDIYFYSIVTITLMPTNLIISLQLKKKIIFFITLALFFFFAIFLSVKILFLIPFAIVFCFYLANSNFIFLVLLFSTLAMIISSIDIINSFNIGLSYKNALFGNFIGRRLFYIPSITNYVYINEFFEGKFLLWRESKLTFNMFKDSHYPMDIAKYIGESYFTQDYSVNSGWIGSGFANNGFVGVIIYSLIIGIYINILNHSNDILLSNFTLPLSITSIIYFLSSDVISCFLTYGFSIIIIFIFFLILPIKDKKI